MRCDTCKHWAEAIDDWQMQGAGMRACTAVKEQWRVEDGLLPAVREGKYGDEDAEAAFVAARNDLFAKAKAVVVDGSSYMAQLRTRPDFGCVLHTPKE